MPVPTHLIALAALSLAATAPAPAADSASPPTEQRQPALQKLKLRFEQADLDASGSLTQEEARKAGLDFVVQHFAEMDQARRGAISFEQLKAYLVARRKQARAQHVPGHDKLP